ncbi:hypothetical protein ACF3NR_06490 [Vaginella massiliensis]|uniref:hypothetical protein n=1 Tax=Vaginella massiliensis TaxID=1816680 RepID=UPI000838D818|nr:hypothetical protein [Vaginella massiliensis]
MSFANVQAQQEAPVAIGKVEINTFGAGVSYELPLSRKFILETAAGVGLGYGVHDNGFETDLSFSSIAPYIRTELRYRYNLDKRTEQGKSTALNSGNYLGLQTKFSFGNSNPDANQVLSVNLHWGIQRNFGTKFVLNAFTGGGVNYDFQNKQMNVLPTVGLRLGFKSF